MNKSEHSFLDPEEMQSMLNTFSIHTSKLFLQPSSQHIPELVPPCKVLKMGQSLKKLGNEEKRDKEVVAAVIERCYDRYFLNTKNWTLADFYHAICETVQEINKKLGSTQFRVPKATTLKQAYDKHHHGKGSLTREEFQKILQEIIWDSGVTGIGAKDLLLYIFGVPVTALFIKQRLMPNAIPNDIFIPGVTSATVFLLAYRNKI